MVNFSIGQIVELKIEKLVYEGYGLAYIEADGKNFVFFVEGVCDGDLVNAVITKIKKNYAYATVKEIIKPSPYRVKPFCALHNACGGCQWQFIDYNHQLEIKRDIVQDILNRSLDSNIKVKDTLPSKNIKEFRCKIQMPVAQTKNSKRFLIGYYKKNSHDIVNIKYCPIQPAIINDITEKIRNNANIYGVTAYNEKNGKGELRHIIYRISKSSKDILICFVVNNNKISKQIKDLSNFIYNEFDNIKGVSINFNTQKNNTILGDKTENILGQKTYIEKLNNISYIISPESFFQVNPESFNNILDIVKEQIIQRINNPSILDAYSGVGSFGLYMSDIAQNITCIEEVKSASNNNISACELNNINNIEVINGDTKNIFESLIKNNKNYDVIILDPPRKGCSKEALEYCRKLTDKLIIYVSCNPNSLARDLKYLKSYGFQLSFAQTADMFCHTYHVETIAVLEKFAN